MKVKFLGGIATALLGVALSTGCGEGTNTDEGESIVPEGNNALSEAALSVPVLGEFLSTCTAQGQALLVEFITTNPTNPVTGPEFTLADLLVDDNDALTLPILGGVGGEGPLSADAVAGAFPEGVPLDTPVLGVAPIMCQDGLVPLDLTSATDYGKTLGAIPVVGETVLGETVQTQGVILAIIGDKGTTDPLPPGTNPFPFDLTDAGIPNGDLSLLERIGELIASLFEFAE
jgi:hypothetical protein